MFAYDFTPYFDVGGIRIVTGDSFTGLSFHFSDCHAEHSEASIERRIHHFEILRYAQNDNSMIW